MKKSWNPRKFSRGRWWRVSIAALATLAVSVAGFFLNTRKAIALEVDGKTRIVTTYASSLPEFLEQQHITIRTHDQAVSSSGPWLADHAVVRVRKAYQVTLNIDGHLIPYWTLANSASQLDSYFASANANAAKVTVNIPNIYNQLTGGLTINQSGPVYVVAGGKTSVAPDGNQTAASILDSKGITVTKNDRVSVQRTDGKTYLLVQRITYGTTTRQVTIPFDSTTVKDPNQYEGTSTVTQKGQDGVRTQTIKVTYVDGKPESETVASSVITKQPVEQITTVGTKKKPAPQPAPAQQNQSQSQQSQTQSNQTQPQQGQAQSQSQAQTDAQKQAAAAKAAQEAAAQAQAQAKKAQEEAQAKAKAQQQAANQKAAQQTAQAKAQAEAAAKAAAAKAAAQKAAAQKAAQQAAAAKAAAARAAAARAAAQKAAAQKAAAQRAAAAKAAAAAAKKKSTTSYSGGGHLSPSEAQTLARGMMRDLYGWSGSQYQCLVTMWNHESGWEWYATNSSSGAYGIPQALPGSKMASAGPDWRNNAATQIRWGLGYIAGRYGTPCGAWSYWQRHHWY